MPTRRQQVTVHKDNKSAGPGRSVRLDFKHRQRGPAVYSQKTAFGQYKPWLDFERT